MSRGDKKDGARDRVVVVPSLASLCPGTCDRKVVGRMVCGMDVRCGGCGAEA